MEQWEDFPHGPTMKNGERVHVTLNKKGGFHFSRRVHESMGAPDFVSFKYDRRIAAIGICPAKGSQPNAFKLYRKNKTPGAGPRVVYAANFLRYFHIFPSETLAFPTAEVRNDGMLVLSLHEVKSVGKPKPVPTR